MDRSFEEQVIDKLLLLYLINKTNEYGLMGGQLKLQKLPFLSELEMNSRGIKGFNYCFFRFRYGPMSKELYNDRDILSLSGMITKHPPYALTERGKDILEQSEKVLRKNSMILKYIDNITKKYAATTPWELTEMIYQIDIILAGPLNKKMKIKEFHFCWDIIRGLKEGEYDQKFKISEHSIDSLHLAFNTTNEDRVKMKRIIPKPYNYA